MTLPPLSSYGPYLLDLLKSWWSSPYKFPRSMLGAGLSLLAAPQLILVVIYLCFGEVQANERSGLRHLLRSAIEQDSWIAILGSSLCLLSVPVFLVVHGKQVATKGAGNAIHIALEFPVLHALGDSHEGHFNPEENESRLRAINALNKYSEVLTAYEDIPDSFVKLHGRDYLTLYEQLMSALDLKVKTSDHEVELGRDLLVPEVRTIAESLRESTNHDQ